MKQSLAEKLWKLQDEMRNDNSRFSLTEVAKRLTETGLTLSTTDLPEFASSLVRVLADKLASITSQR